MFTTNDIADQVGAPFEREGMKRESLQRAVREVLNALVADGRVERLGAQGYRCAPSDTAQEDGGSAEYATLH